MLRYTYIDMDIYIYRSSIELIPTAVILQHPYLFACRAGGKFMGGRVCEGIYEYTHII